MDESHVSKALFFAWLTSWISFTAASWAWCLETEASVATAFWLLVNLSVVAIAAGAAWYRRKEGG